ncbi:hypothetical protein HRJ45_01830 [Vibrio coralliilyticus]|uniref:hypothetical protein n=1 Tax=Vibrio coralliilyticus TaxID=190893 RepID=UPI00148DB04C|nr:hypothetical protein [Vibrio coralliilyticus]NRF77831.1 hypothetical protein [Vibrio coralliilyticus]
MRIYQQTVFLLYVPSSIGSLYITFDVKRLTVLCSLVISRKSLAIYHAKSPTQWLGVG